MKAFTPSPSKAFGEEEGAGSGILKRHKDKGRCASQEALLTLILSQLLSDTKQSAFG